jgi:prepilin-type N-terminal cleavage/methylation domain-containing protein
MHREGFTIAELTVTIAIVAVIAGIGLPRLRRSLDWVAADAAARDISTALAVARATAAMQGVRTRVVIAVDSLRLDRWEAPLWVPGRRWPGPASRGVTLEVSNPEVVFGPLGLAWGVSNTRVTLQRGTNIEVLTVSVVGRVKRW